MGSVIKRITPFIAALALIVPTGAQATTTWYGPEAYAAGPIGGQQNATMTSADTSTGEVSAFQAQFAGISGNLGCNAQGPFAFFDIPHTGSVDEVIVEFSEAIVTPYAFMKVSLLEGQGDDATYVDTRNLRGAVLGDGSFAVSLSETVTGDVTARVGIEVSSNCPAVDGGRAIISRVGFVESDA